ncbi:hypothetical protein NPIL_605231 [Nephila pilipes]|uniref:Uncharacterized protein n=1 Tax=Nephila pilipes TaxID=299642 RepID=A0A8X6Q5J5_NEPPI|nr:hypothetical protein NPIL_605231 [Nephila pilipes]
MNFGGRFEEIRFIAMLFKSLALNGGAEKWVKFHYRDFKHAPTASVRQQRFTAATASAAEPAAAQRRVRAGGVSVRCGVLQCAVVPHSAESMAAGAASGMQRCQ